MIPDQVFTAWANLDPVAAMLMPRKSFVVGLLEDAKELANYIRAQQDEMVALRAARAGDEQEADALREELVELRDRVDAVSMFNPEARAVDTVQTLRVECECLRSMNTNQARTIGDLQSEVGLLTNERDDLTEANEHQTRLVAELRVENADQAATIRGLRVEIDSGRAAYDQLRDYTRRDLDALRAERDGMQRDLDALRRATAVSAPATGAPDGWSPEASAEYTDTPTTETVLAERLELDRPNRPWMDPDPVMRTAPEAQWRPDARERRADRAEWSLGFPDP